MRVFGANATLHPHRFNRTLDNVEFPRSLKKLELSSSFNQSVVGARWPPELEVQFFLSFIYLYTTEGLGVLCVESKERSSFLVVLVHVLGGGGAEVK